MSLPVLYPANERNFSDNGLGAMSDAVSCEVTEELNGEFELEMQYPLDGVHYAEIAMRTLILARPNAYDAAQPFRVYRISRPIGRIATIYARHISYDMSGIIIKPFASTSMGETVQAINDNAVSENPFELTVDFPESDSMGGMEVAEPINLRSLLLGDSNSLLSTYNGEYKYDGFVVTLCKHRGTGDGMRIQYGKNLTDLKQDENNGDLYTGIYPYWTDSAESKKIVELPEKIVNAEGSFEIDRFLPVDFSSEFDSAPSEEDLRERAEKYIKDNKIGVPQVSIDVSFVQMRQDPEYRDLKILDDAVLGDTVRVLFFAMGVETAATVIKTQYDVLRDRYISISVGDKKKLITKTIQEIKDAQEKSKKKEESDEENGEGNEKTHEMHWLEFTDKVADIAYGPHTYYMDESEHPETVAESIMITFGAGE